jgi:hypothetical protein
MARLDDDKYRAGFDLFNASGTLRQAVEQSGDDEPDVDFLLGFVGALIDNLRRAP